VHGTTGLAIASYWPHWTMIVGRGFWVRYAEPIVRQLFGF
jgi:hypothetical protein